MNKNDAKTEALGLLHRGVADLMTSDGWRRALEFRSRFHAYSFFNASLILAQKPEATLVAGYRRWQEAGRFVRKGEKGIAILAPLLRQDPEDPDNRVLVGFKTVYVFDVSQTEGEPVPRRPAPQLLEDTPQDRAKLAGLTYRLSAFCALRGVTVSFDFEHPHALGVYQPGARRIAVKPGLTTSQAFKTLCHEAAHMLLHTGSEERSSAELEAETAAFLTCHALGVDTSSYSFAYLAIWAESLEALIQAGDRASKAADTLVEYLSASADAERVDQAVA